VSLGIRLIRSRPGKPQDNGGHERMRRDLAELELAPARSRRAQQRDCDRWLVDFNNVRPHEALGGKTPAEVYKPSHRAPAVQLGFGGDLSYYTTNTWSAGTRDDHLKPWQDSGTRADWLRAAGCKP